ncbi:tRNA (adenosine(37)-N6)-threonylcarbamoyltransferase complex transferase subunit TsaD [Candidatus Saccharibacteria bacterium]|nr:tRNA (adenosine(37)-N6)-threonylcarbamoyltransferase complex transferase subunit TsaD [Candidatus Saccharibacteria bacterium]MBQ6313463.1 tRNA (adenosine(37)-N6)-threonylcarbamoyltransferase complex transferase subunit TsaD [Candidatus Saccharibacteria bacterium]
MKILGIETSCDETAASVVEDGVSILSNVVVSQIDIFKEYGGVIPEVAARSHLEVIMPVINKALADASCSWDDIDAIAVTHAPGLLGSLLIGTLTARTLAILHNKPLYAVHHLKSHVYANWVWAIEEYSALEPGRPPVFTGDDLCRRELRDGEHALEPEYSSTPQFPLLALVVSGGHTQILYMRGHNQFEIVGTTVDDAVGECFDKVAKILGLPYPGGPSISAAAEGQHVLLGRAQGRSAKLTVLKEHADLQPGDATKYRFPHPKVEGLNFSFSGLKTAVLREVQKTLDLPISHPSHDLKNHLDSQQVADFAASFQKTAVDILAEKLEMALEKYPEVASVVVAGGVSANKVLREKLTSLSESRKIPVFFPAPMLSGDNGVMVAAAAYYEILSGVKPTDPYKLNIYPRISVEN